MTDQVTDNETPVVILGGKSWPIPKLAVRQLRKVRGPLIEMNNRIRAALETGDTEGAKLNAASDVMLSLDEGDYERLLLKVVFWGLTRGNPNLSYDDDFLNMEVADDEITTAWFVVRNQSGLFVFSDQKDDASEGEATGVTQSPSQTGTA